MNKPTQSRYLSLFLVSGFVLTAVACGGAAPAPEPEQPAAAPIATDPAPVPELRTTAAGAVLVSQDEVVRMIGAGTAPMILDVRTAEEFAAGHVPGAINISHDELPDRLAEIEAARADGVIVYCRSGRRAGIAEELLLSQGFSNVQHLDGDMLAWLEAQRPVEKPQQ